MEGNTVTSQKKEPAVFILENNYAVYWDQSLAAPLSISFTQDAVMDMEVVKREKLEALLQAFLEANTLSPKNLLIILAKSILFEKDIPLDKALELTEEEQTFLDSVPFEHILSKSFHLNKNIKIVAANKDFCDAIKKFFLTRNFQINAIVPLSIAEETISELQGNVDLSLLMKKIDFLKQYTLFTPEVVPVPFIKTDNKKEKRKLIIVAGFCAGSLLVLLYVVFHIAFRVF